MAKSLTKRAETSHKLFLALIEALRVGTMAWLAAGEFLSKLKKNNAFKDVMGEPPAGGQWTLDDFLGQGEIGLPYSTAAKLIQCYQVFKERLELPDGAIGKIRFYRLKAIAPYVTEKNQEKLLDAAEHLSRSDFEQVLIKEAKDIDQDSCIHDFKSVTLKECKICGLRRRA